MSKNRTSQSNKTKRRRIVGTIPAGKWVKEISPETPTRSAARVCLQLRFDTVLYWFRRAAEHPEEDIENVHQLRVSLRRVTTNVRAFRAFLKGKAGRELQESFRTILKGAGAARDADVLLARFRAAEPEPTPGVEGVIERLTKERQTAQEEILEAYRELPPERLQEQFEKATLLLSKKKKTKKARKVEKRFGQFARHLIRPFSQSFNATYQAIGGEIAQLHAFRIAGKKLRYALEIAAPAFTKGPRREVYRELVSLQDYLGMLNDHHQMIIRLEDWPERDGVVEGMLASERMIVSDLHGVFPEWWPKRKHERFVQSFASLITDRNGT